MRASQNLLSLSAIVLSLSGISCAHQSSSISRSLPERAPVSRAPTQQATAPSPTGLYFDWPVDRARMTRGFLPKQRRPHYGLDLAAPKGTPILASTGGRVIYRGKDFRGFGNLVMIESAGGWATLYAHLDRFMVSEGQMVRMGEVIGTMGRTGRATGVHLHFEIRRGPTPVDPLPFLPGGRKLASK